MIDFFENSVAISRQLAKKRGTPLNYFLSPYIERYLKRIEAQLGMPEGPMDASSVDVNPLANAIRQGGMLGDMDMESSNY